MQVMKIDSFLWTTKIQPNSFFRAEARAIRIGKGANHWAKSHLQPNESTLKNGVQCTNAVQLIEDGSYMSLEVRMEFSLQ